MSSRPVDPPDGLSLPGMDKVAHAVIFGGLAAVVSIGLRRAKHPPGHVVQFYVPIVFAALYGLSDEIHQYFVPERTFSLLDWLADCLGAWLVQMLLRYGLWRERSEPMDS
jgi:VanZ family protein